MKTSGVKEGILGTQPGGGNWSACRQSDSLINDWPYGAVWNHAVRT